MQLVTLLLFLTTFSISAQSQNTKDNCNVEMTKKAILMAAFDEIDCPFLKNKTIINFKVKVPKYKTVLVKGNLFNDEATSYIAKTTTGDKIVLFDIEVKKDEKIPSFIITIIE